MPPPADTELRRRTKAEGKSLNAVVIEALPFSTGVGETPIRPASSRYWAEGPTLDILKVNHGPNCSLTLSSPFWPRFFQLS
jgi:hypothetical protein